MRQQNQGKGHGRRRQVRRTRCCSGGGAFVVVVHPVFNRIAVLVIRRSFWFGDRNFLAQRRQTRHDLLHQRMDGRGGHQCRLFQGRQVIHPLPGKLHKQILVLGRHSVVDVARMVIVGRAQRQVALHTQAKQGFAVGHTVFTQRRNVCVHGRPLGDVLGTDVLQEMLLEVWINVVRCDVEQQVQCGFKGGRDGLVVLVDNGGALLQHLLLCGGWGGQRHGLIQQGQGCCTDGTCVVGEGDNMYVFGFTHC